MQQLTLAWLAEFERYGKKTRREQFLCEMEAVMPWAELLPLVAPYYSKGETGRKPVGLAIMLRVYFLHPARPRTKSGSVIRRCIRRAKEISGTSR